ncbi:L-threonylcarbamoyladenylate synthase [Pseudarthrobacter sp. P1]|uniref:L-threonylcarbamoyladenylate synthase n=1 Tax=Pseudarthrobacter sp. P1 TaxID=3418418 RepID=UPI003CF71DD2
MSTTSYNCTAPDQRSEGLAHAQKAIAAKQVIVMPTDTVYGIAADAFSPQAVATLLAAKGRSRTMPPPVLIPRLHTMDGLAADVSADARALAEKFWPGGLTLIMHAQPSLTWDLGDTLGTVALRVPDDELALDLLTITGPLAVSSANRTGQPAAQTASEARAQLAESVEVYLEAGFRPAEGAGNVPSTIVDATGDRLKVVREGAITLEQLRSVVPSVLGLGEEVAMWSPASEPEAAEGEAAAETPAAAEAAEAAAEAAFAAYAAAEGGEGSRRAPAGPAEEPAAPTAADEAPPVQPSPGAGTGQTT